MEIHIEKKIDLVSGLFQHPINLEFFQEEKKSIQPQAKKFSKTGLNIDQHLLAKFFTKK